MGVSSGQRLRVIIAGGGVAGLEALIGLRRLAGDLVEVTLVAPATDFVYKPTIVGEPFGGVTAEHRALAPLVEEMGARLVRDSLSSVDLKERRIALARDAEESYDVLLVCVGARTRPAFRHAVNFDATGPSISLAQLLGGLDGRDRLAFVVPPGVTWALPLYELALMSQRSAWQSGLHELRFAIVTPEPQPLALLGRTASDEVRKLLEHRNIQCLTGAYIHEADDRTLIVTPGDRPLEADRVVALPELDGPGIPGLPADEHGFITIDENCRLPGSADVYAAGDGTTFPIKQGGLATQQADAIVEQVAARAGASVDPKPFRPVLRGQLLTGDESLYARTDLAGGEGEGITSREYLWWPPHKIGGRYLPAYLAHEEPHEDLDPPVRPLDVEVALPHDWHEQPIGFHRLPLSD